MTASYTVRSFNAEVHTIDRDGVPVCSVHLRRLPFGHDIAYRVAAVLAECEAENRAEDDQ